NVLQHQEVVALRAGLIPYAVASGRLDEARAQLAALTRDDLAIVKDDASYPGVLCMLAEAAVGLGASDDCDRLLPRLRPFGGLFVALPGFVGFVGAADRYLGMLTARLGRAAESDALFESAIELEERMKAPAYVARTTLAYAKELAARGERLR